MNFKCLIIAILWLGVVVTSCGQEMKSISIDSDLSEVQPMTGLVFWPTNSRVDTDAISLEYSYMNYDEVVESEGVYDWTGVDQLLDEMKSRNHQGILRFRFTYPGKTTTVPQYIKDREDYTEIVETSEGKNTWFPDWTNEELQRFTLEFYERFAERYDTDNRLAFVQTGFGLWAEYHIYSGPFVLGKTFPSKAFQEKFIYAMDQYFKETYWSISIDAASSSYSPFEAKQELLALDFGLFDDSFMHSEHAGYNEESWNFFDRERYSIAPAGGEFSYYSDHDQRYVLRPDEGAHGEPFEKAVERFHMTYILGNDQPRFHDISRIKEASKYMGYRFKINSFKSKEGRSEIEIENVGVAPIYINAFLAVNSVRSDKSLKLLKPGQILQVVINEGSESPILTIESDDILATQTIGYYGTVNEPYVYRPKEIEETILSLDDSKDDLFKHISVFKQGNILTIQSHSESILFLEVYSIAGKQLYANTHVQNGSMESINLNERTSEIIILRTNLGVVKVMLK